MKKLKKLMAVVLALMVALTMGIATSSMAFGAEGKTITLSGGKAGHTYTLYQIFTGTVEEVEGVEQLTNLQWGSGITAAFKNTKETAAAYGIDAQTLAEQLGYSSAENYVQYEASSNIMSALIVDRVMLDLQIRYSQEELMEQLSQDVRMSYGSAMTAEDYMEKSGAVGMWAYTNLQYKYGLVTAALEERAVLVPAAGSAQE